MRASALGVRAHFLLAGLFAALAAACDAGPGAPRLKAGAAAVIVTPPVETFTDKNENGVWDPEEKWVELNADGVWTPVWIAGFGMNRPALGVHDDLYARALVVERGELRIGIVGVDWVGLLYDDALQLRAEVEAAGLALDQLVLVSSHNHEGPDTMGIWGPSVLETGRDPAYLADAFGAIVRALREAAETLVPVRIRAGVGRTQGLTRDSRLPEVKAERVVALRFDPEDGSAPVAVVVHWSNHPEVLGSRNQLITADFPGFLISALEQGVPGAVGIYWQGTLGGLMTPLGVDIRDEQGNQLSDGTFEKAQRLGHLVAAEALVALEAGQDATADGRLAFRRRELLLPIDNEMFKLAAHIGLIERRTFDADGLEVLPLELKTPYLLTEVTAIELGAAQIATVPGELYPELALVGPNGEPLYQHPQEADVDYPGIECAKPIHSAMRETPFQMVLGLANDELGYLIPKCQYDREAPYAYERDRPQYGEELSPGPDVSPAINAALVEMFQQLASDRGD